MGLYLKRVCDGKLIEAEMKEINYSKKTFEGWLFDWSIPFKKGYQVLAIYVKGDKRVQGAIAIKATKNFSYEVDVVEVSPFNSSYSKKDIKKEYTEIGLALFAEVCKISFDSGYDGYVEFNAKTKLIRYYKEKLGAKQINAQKMYINTEAALKLVNRYYGGKI